MYYMLYLHMYHLMHVQVKMYSIMTILHDTVLYTWNFLRVDCF